jgi:nicotinamidase-related amidase
MCVDATTRAVKDFGFSCTLVSDACATLDLTVEGEVVSARDVQRAFVGALGYFYATVTNTENYIRSKPLNKYAQNVLFRRHHRRDF